MDWWCAIAVWCASAGSRHLSGNINSMWRGKLRVRKEVVEACRGEWDGGEEGVDVEFVAGMCLIRGSGARKVGKALSRWEKTSGWAHCHDEDWVLEDLDRVARMSATRQMLSTVLTPTGGGSVAFAAWLHHVAFPNPEEGVAFVEIGAGAGVLSAALEVLGHCPVGVWDVEVRPEWDLLPSSIRDVIGLAPRILSQEDVERIDWAPGQASGDYQSRPLWVVSLHSDEATPWVVPIARGVGADGAVVVPCCPYGRDGVLLDGVDDYICYLQDGDDGGGDDGGGEGAGVYVLPLPKADTCQGYVFHLQQSSGPQSSGPGWIRGGG